MIGILIGAGLLFYPNKDEIQLSQLPNVAFTTPDKINHTLAEFNESQIILVHFWATWCPPCLPEIPELVALAKANPNITILAFSLDRSEAIMQSFFSLKFKEMPPNFIPIWDEKGKIAQTEFYSFNYPETYILNCNLELLDKKIGAESNWKNALQAFIKQTQNQICAAAKTQP